MIASQSQEQFEPYQTELLGWFERNAPALGRLYKGAITMVNDPSFPGRIRFVSHAVREIANSLPDAIAGPRTEKRFDWQKELDQIVMSWIATDLPLETGVTPIMAEEELEALPVEPAQPLEIPSNLAQEIQRMLIDHRETTESRREAAHRLFESVAPENVQMRETLSPIMGEWMKTVRWFTGKAHHPRGKVEEDPNSELEDKFLLFEHSLVALTGEFYKPIEGLDDILQDTNP